MCSAAAPCSRQRQIEPSLRGHRTRRPAWPGPPATEPDVQPPPQSVQPPAVILPAGLAGVQRARRKRARAALARAWRGWPGCWTSRRRASAKAVRRVRKLLLREMLPALPPPRVVPRPAAPRPSSQCQRAERGSERPLAVLAPPPWPPPAPSWDWDGGANVAERAERRPVQRLPCSLPRRYGSG